MGAMWRKGGRLAACAAACAAALLCTAALAGCGPQANVTEASPQLEPAGMAASCEGGDAETAQRIEVVLSCGEELAASGDIEGDFEVLLNGEELDRDVVDLSVTAAADTVTFVLFPGKDAQAGPGAGEYFAVYQGQISIASARDDGALPHLQSAATGDTAVLSAPVEGTLPSGLAIELTSQTPGSAAEGERAQATFEVTSPATVRAITWLSLDGGQTKLLKHNHLFMQCDAQACAEDLARVINDSDTGFSAAARGCEVAVRASEPVDGQLIEPCVVEGFGVAGGAYDGSVG